MGIPVLSVDGLLIRTARTYVLKCRVCSGYKLIFSISKNYKYLYM
jgi:hypothetical protein